MAVITRLADLPGLKEPAAGLKRAAVVFGLVISWPICLVSKNLPLASKGLRWFLDW